MATVYLTPQERDFYNQQDAQIRQKYDQMYASLKNPTEKQKRKLQEQQNKEIQKLNKTFQQSRREELKQLLKQSDLSKEQQQRVSSLQESGIKPASSALENLQQLASVALPIAGTATGLALGGPMGAAAGLAGGSALGSAVRPRDKGQGLLGKAGEALYGTEDELKQIPTITPQQQQLYNAILEKIGPQLIEQLSQPQKSPFEQLLGSQASNVIGSQNLTNMLAGLLGSGIASMGGQQPQFGGFQPSSGGSDMLSSLLGSLAAPVAQQAGEYLKPAAQQAYGSISGMLGSLLNQNQ